MPVAWMYILTNRHNTVLYVGATNDLPTRLWEHRTKQNKNSFTSRYNVYKLIYYEEYDSEEEAFERERFVKGKLRKWKLALVDSSNPDWKDLTESITV